MKDPRKNPLPTSTDRIEEIHIFAADLAYGYKVGEFADRYTVIWVDHDQPYSWIPLGADDDLFDTYLSEKWANNPPPPHLLADYGYLRSDDGGLMSITATALELLKDPRFRDS